MYIGLIGVGLWYALVTAASNPILSVPYTCRDLTDVKSLPGIAQAFGADPDAVKARTQEMDHYVTLMLMLHYPAMATPSKRYTFDSALLSYCSGHPFIDLPQAIGLTAALNSQ
jgi:hypothetical protein